MTFNNLAHTFFTSLQLKRADFKMYGSIISNYFFSSLPLREWLLHLELKAKALEKDKTGKKY